MSRISLGRSLARRSFVFAGVALAVWATACKKSEPRTEEIFQAQSRGLGFLERDQLPEAEAEFKKVIALAPGEPLGYANLGLTYLRGSRYADAEKQLDRARALDPENADIGLTAAKLYALTGRLPRARTTLEELQRTSPTNAHVAYALAEIDARAPASDAAAAARRENQLGKVMAAAPMNLAARLELIDALLRRGAVDSAVHQLEDGGGRIGPDVPADARPLFDESIRLLRAGKVDQGRNAFQRFRQTMEGTSAYQESLADVKWLDGPIAGRPILTFTPKTLVTLRGAAPKTPAADVVRFIDVTSDAGLPSPEAPPPGTAVPSAIAAGDYDGDGTDDLFASAWSSADHAAVARLYRVHGGQVADVTSRSGISLPGGAVFATFADVDNDGRLDLFAIGADRRAHLYHNAAGGRFEDVSAKSRISLPEGARKALFADLDHDGDLDLLLVGGGSAVLYRNNLDGTFTNVSRAAGLNEASPGSVTRDAAFGDFDGDGRIDVLVVNDRGRGALYRNAGNGRFTDVMAKSGLSFAGASAVAVGDYNNDGAIDVFVAGANAGESSLWLNNGDGTFRRDTRSNAALARLGARGSTIVEAQFLDYDNDGWLDLLVTGESADGARGVWLLHNDGKGVFSDRSRVLPAGVKSAERAVATDVDGDGDLDLFLATRDGVRLLRNDGGNTSLSMQVQLAGLRTGAGKNNDFGIGATVQARAGELFQTRVVTSRVTHFGLGTHLKADVVRVWWPNGVPQTVYFPGSDQDVIENEVLKGSCAFLYTWDGTRFRFATDVMWRSALGMPLGLMAGGASAYAPAGASQEYLRIPGGSLRPRDGTYTLQLTEELWETAFVDQLKLLAVDHPDSIGVFVDERFVPPGPVSLKLFRVVRPHPPVSAVDDHGTDVLDALRENDDRYVSNLSPLRYQGLVEPHDLILDLGPDAGADSSLLVLRGWIYPTDASINVALSQQSRLAPVMPSLAVHDASGRWTTVIPNLSFPSGKGKTMVVELGHLFPTRDHHVRIRTNLQIYWDQAFVAREAGAASVRVTPLEASSADLHFRGYSRTYRKGGRYGPWWFDYDSVTTAPMWRPIEGAFTRFGDVLPLLRESDDEYVIIAPGDEATIRFDASSAERIPRGWTRDFLLYTDGWIKDSDLNTAFGTSVGPLPFHAIRSYPYQAGDAYPADSVHRRYLREYDTRRVSRSAKR
jgi:Tfp pilus assembly protein PilF